MPSVKIPRKSTDTDMTPFVDVAFLILSFFMLATKFKPPEPVEISTPYSVSSQKLEEQDALLTEIAPDGRVFFTMQLNKPEDQGLKMELIQNINNARNLGLTQAEMSAFVKTPTVGLPFANLKQFLSLPETKRKEVKQTGIPVTDSASNELYYWVRDATILMAGNGVKFDFMIKGDNEAKFPTFKGVIDAMRRNEQFKYKLITSPEEAPAGSDLYRTRASGGGASEAEG